MDERLKFIARLLDGDKMAALCREFGISRKTGYKILTRYNEIRTGGPHRPISPALPPARRGVTVEVTVEVYLVRAQPTMKFVPFQHADPAMLPTAVSWYC